MHWTVLRTLGLIFAAGVQAQNTTYFFAFGDSYTTTSSDWTQTKPSASNPIGNPTWPGATSSGGYNWINHLLATYNTTLMLGWNLAYGGCTSNSSLVVPYPDWAPDLSRQIDNFVQYANESVPWTAENSVFGLWMGLNDIGNSYGNTTNDEANLISKIMKSHMGALERLRGYGAKHFIILNVSPTEKTPRLIERGSAQQAKIAEAISQFNIAQNTTVSAFRAEHPAARVVYVDVQETFNKVLNDPTAFKAPNSSCFNSDGVSCLWWDDYHPGQAIQKLLAETVVKAWPKNATTFWRLK